MPRIAKDLTGLRFGKLVAVCPINSVNLRWRWEFRCDCGAIVEREGREVAKAVKRGNIPQCPACARKAASERMRTHGMTNTRIYAVWHSMVQRCTEPTHQVWAHYGGRGITVCERWRKFENFLEDMGSTYQKGLVLDRINNNAGYSPQNCRWATPRENVRNGRNSLTIDVVELSKQTGISRSTIYYRLAHGWPIELVAAVKPNRRNGTLHLYSDKPSGEKKYSTYSTVESDTVSQ